MGRMILFGALFALAACTTSDSGSTSGSGGTPPSPRGFSGEWTLKADDTILTCRLKVTASAGNNSGSVDQFGCIGSNAFRGFPRRWEREGGRIAIYSFGADGPVAAVRRSGRNEFRGRFIPSGRTFVLTRR